MLKSWGTIVWFIIIGIGVLWEFVGLVLSGVPTLSEIISRFLRDIGPYGRVAFVAIWIWLAWHFLTGRIFQK